MNSVVTDLTLLFARNEGSAPCALITWFIKVLLPSPIDPMTMNFLVFSSAKAGSAYTILEISDYKLFYYKATSTNFNQIDQKLRIFTN